MEWVAGTGREQVVRLPLATLVSVFMSKYFEVLLESAVVVLAVWPDTRWHDE